MPEKELIDLKDNFENLNLIYRYSTCDCENQFISKSYENYAVLNLLRLWHAYQVVTGKTEILFLKRLV